MSLSACPSPPPCPCSPRWLLPGLLLGRARGRSPHGMLGPWKQVASVVPICNHPAIYPILQVRRLSLGEAVAPPTCLTAGKGLCGLGHTHQQPLCHRAGPGVPILPTVPGTWLGLRNHLLNEPQCVHTCTPRSQKPDAEGRASSGRALPEVPCATLVCLLPPRSQQCSLRDACPAAYHTPLTSLGSTLSESTVGGRTKEGLEGGCHVCGKRISRQGQSSALSLSCGMTPVKTLGSAGLSPGTFQWPQGWRRKVRTGSDLSGTPAQAGCRAG